MSTLLVLLAIATVVALVGAFRLGARRGFDQGYAAAERDQVVLIDRHLRGIEEAKVRQLAAEGRLEISRASLRVLQERAGIR